MFNIGAYKQLANRYDDLDERTTIVENFVEKLKYRFFGFEEDNGHGQIDEFEVQVDDIETKLDKIKTIIENESDQREKDFRWLNKKIDNLVYQLVAEEDLDIDRDSLAE